MRAAMRSISACSFSAMNGSATRSEMKIARIFGTNAIVISWICVSACNSEIARPTARPTSITGLATRMRVTMASRATSRTSAPLISTSNRHLHDFFVGRDHPIAHRDHGVDRNLGLRHRGNDVDHVAFALHRRSRLRVGLLSRLADRLHRLLENIPEAADALVHANRT